MRPLVVLEEASEMVSVRPLKAMPLCPGNQTDDGVLTLNMSSDPIVCIDVRSAVCVADGLSWLSSKVKRNNNVSSQVRPVKLVPLQAAAIRTQSAYGRVDICICCAQHKAHAHADVSMHT